MSVCRFYSHCYRLFLKEALHTDRDDALFLHRQYCFTSYRSCARYRLRQGLEVIPDEIDRKTA